MRKTTSKYIGVSFRKYKNSTQEKSNTKPWIATLDHKGVRVLQKHCSSERGAALAVDMKRIELNLPPLNILKPKQ